jgi:hypothetical protein
VIAIWGPFWPDLFFVEGRPLDLFAMIGYDGPAVAWWLAGFAVVAGAVTARDDHPDRLGSWSAMAVVVLLASAVLTRYAMAGGVVGLIVGLLWARWSWGAPERRWRLVLLALFIPLTWQVLVYPLLLENTGPKAFAVHRGDISPIGSTLGGWFGLELVGRRADVLIILIVAALVLVAVRARPGNVVSLASAAAAAQILLLVLARQFLDASLNLREERHVLLVRFLLTLLAVCGVRALVSRVTAARGDRVQRIAVAVAAPALAVAAAIAAAGWPGPRELRPPRTQLAVGTWLSEHGNRPVLSNISEGWYMLTGVPAADLPRTVEPTTLVRRNVDIEIAELAVTFGTVVQAYRPGFFDSVDLRDVACASVQDVLTAPADALSGFELALVDLTQCE